MSKLDAKALEAADDALRNEFDRAGSVMSDWTRAAVTAYLDALPPAKRYWALMLDSSEPYLYDDKGEACSNLPSGDKVVEVEVREVREP